MNDTPNNPYEAFLPITGGASRGPSSSEPIRLTPIWIWVPCALGAAFWAMPSDPISLLLYWGFGVICFCAGATVGSHLHFGVRVLVCVVWIGPALAFTLDFLRYEWAGVAYTVGTALFVVGSFGCGYWASHCISRGRFRIVAACCLGHLLGLAVSIPLSRVMWRSGFLVVLLCIAGGAICAAAMARRSLLASAPQPDRESDVES